MDAQAPFVLIDDARPSATGESGARLFANPHQILSCDHIDDVPQTRDRIEQAVADGHYVAGYMAYELGYALEPKLTPLLPDSRDGPLIWMGVFDAPVEVDDILFNTWAQAPHSIGEMRTALKRDDYITQVNQIREHIRAGDVYQINHTFKQRFEFSGSPLSLYAHLRRKQRAHYGALIADGSQHILSLSPELFFETQNTVVRTRPMKGTAARGATPMDDDAQKHWLCHDEKSKAENLMIVDLLRNDLGRVALVGSVNVTDLFTVETYPTLHQMTSGVEARLRPGTGFKNLMDALFPCGSVTGAPKLKAMEIIHNLESEPRGVYTGAMGYIAPNKDARFNVSIRTITLKNDAGEMGIGSGIVYDSDPASEWDECHLKADFLTKPHQPFELLETLLWERETGFALLQRHLDRLQNSAAYFCYPYAQDRVVTALHDGVGAQDADTLRVRLLLDQDGVPNVEIKPLNALNESGELRFVLSNQTIDKTNPFVFHKTTNRAFYDDERKRQHEITGCDEVVFLNEGGQITEGSITNIFIERDATLLTPPISCGLLNGTLRQNLIDAGSAVEAVLKPDDLQQAERIWLGNSVRGLMPARLINANL